MLEYGIVIQVDIWVNIYMSMLQDILWHILYIYTYRCNNGDVLVLLETVDFAQKKCKWKNDKPLDFVVPNSVKPILGPVSWKLETPSLFFRICFSILDIPNMTVGKARLQHGINTEYLSVHIAFTIAMLLVLVDYHNWIISPRGPGIGMLKDSQRSMSEIDRRFFHMGIFHIPSGNFRVCYGKK